jgi:hypothetical protein
LNALFSVLIKLQTSLMLSFTFELFIEISFRYIEPGVNAIKPLKTETRSLPSQLDTAKSS